MLNYFHAVFKKVFLSMVKKRTFCLLVLIINFSSYSQNLKKKDSLDTMQVIDSLLVDRNLNNWSVRLYANIKAQGFKLSNDADLIFTPNNLYGVGVGLATRKLILDIGFNLKNKRNEQTDRFDLRAGFFLKKNFIDFYIQVYEGFNIKNSINDTKIFRKDIKSIAVGIDYLYLINRGGFSTSLLRSGLESQKQNIYSFGLGGFVFFNQISGDTSIVPQEYYSFFNEQARIIDFTDYGFGIMGGLVSVLKLPSNFYLGLSVKIGAGLNVQHVKAESITYNANISGIYKINVKALIGYKWNRFYTNLSTEGSRYRTDIGFGNDGAFTFIRGKIVLGYRIRDNKNR